MFLSNNILNNLISKATEDELCSLSRLIDKDSKEVYSYDYIQQEICLIGGHSVSNVYRGFSSDKLFEGIFDFDISKVSDAFDSKGTSYLDILDDIIKELDIKTNIQYSSEFDDNKNYTEKAVLFTEEAERLIATKILEKKYELMTEKEKKEFNEKMNILINKSLSTNTKYYSGVAGLLVIAKMGGFTTYTLLTSVMSSISLGTLGFGAYTAMTSALSIAIGPIGWAGLGLATIYKFGEPNIEKLIPIVIVIGALRQRIKLEEDISKKNKSKKQSPKKTVSKQNSIELLGEKLGRYKK